MIRHEKRIKLAAFQLLRKFYNMLKIEIGIRISTRIPPRAGMDCHRPHKGP